MVLLGLMPVYNNEATLPPVLDALKRLDPAPDYWIFLDGSVRDGPSTDNSRWILEQSGLGEVRFAPIFRRFIVEGMFDLVAAARQLLLLVARDRKADAVLWCDADVEILDLDLIDWMTGADFNVNRHLDEVWGTSSCSGLFEVGHDVLVDERVNFYPPLKGQPEDHSYLLTALRLGYTVNHVDARIRHVSGNPERPWTRTQEYIGHVDRSIWLRDPTRIRRFQAF